MRARYAVALVFAVVLDIADFIVGWIPIAGDALDLVGIIIIFLFVGKAALLGAVEFIPFADFLPMFTLAVLLAVREARKQKVRTL